MKQPDSTRKNWWWLAALLLAYWALIFFLTHRPTNPVGIQGLDKVAHFLAYFFLTTLLSLTVRTLGGKSFRWQAGVLLVVVSYGAFDEFMQQLMPGREPDWFDWVADTSGAIAALILLWALRLAFTSRVVSETDSQKVSQADHQPDPADLR